MKKSKNTRNKQQTEKQLIIHKKKMVEKNLRKIS